MNTEKPRCIDVDHAKHPLVTVYYEKPEDRRVTTVALAAMGIPPEKMQEHLSLDCNFGLHLSFPAIRSYRAIYNSLTQQELDHATTRLLHSA